MMVDSSGFGVGAVVMVVQAGDSVGKMMGMEGVGSAVAGGGGDEQDVMRRIEERRKRKEERCFMRGYC
jgi:hypothetical protein